MPVYELALFFQEFVFGLPASKVKKTQLSSQFQVTFSHLLYLKFYNQLCCMEPFFVFNDSPFHYHACSGTADIALDN